MIEKDAILKIKSLNKEIFKVGFLYDDCRKISQLEESLRSIKPDLHTFFHSLWSLSAIEKFKAIEQQNLDNYAKWLQKSFFDRFPKYLAANSLITESFTPNLYKILKIHEELRVLLLEVMICEFQNRKKNYF